MIYAIFPVAIYGIVCSMVGIYGFSFILYNSPRNPLTESLRWNVLGWLMLISFTSLPISIITYFIIFIQQ